MHEGFRQQLADIFVRLRATISRSRSGGASCAAGSARTRTRSRGVAHFLVAGLEGAILMSKVTKDITVIERCVDELKQHLTLYRN